MDVFTSILQNNEDFGLFKMCRRNVHESRWAGFVRYTDRRFKMQGSATSAVDTNWGSITLRKCRAMNLSAASDTQFLPPFPAHSRSADLQIPLFPILLISFSASSARLSSSILLLALLPYFLCLVSKRPVLRESLIAILQSGRQQRVNYYKILNFFKKIIITYMLDWFLQIPKENNIFTTTYNELCGNSILAKTEEINYA